MTLEEITARIRSAIQPQLDALEALFDTYVPRVIGKHHPEYKPAGGSYLRIAEPQRRLLTGYLIVACPNRDCSYSDSGYDYDLITADFNKHRAECQAGR